MFIWIFLISGQLMAKQVCAPNPNGASFNLGCKMVSEEEAKKLQEEIDKDKSTFVKTSASSNKEFQTIEIARQSQTPGFVVKIKQQSLEALVLTAEAIAVLNKTFANTPVEKTHLCEVQGTQQASVFTVFSVKSCK